MNVPGRRGGGSAPRKKNKKGGTTTANSSSKSSNNSKRKRQDDEEQQSSSLSQDHELSEQPPSSENEKEEEDGTNNNNNNEDEEQAQPKKKRYKTPEETLGRWLYEQNYNYIRNKLPQERYDALVSIGYVFETKDGETKKDDLWNSMYDKLKEYKKRYGNLDVPYEWEEDPSLCKFLFFFFLSLFG